MVISQNLAVLRVTHHTLQVRFRIKIMPHLIPFLHLDRFFYFCKRSLVSLTRVPFTVLVKENRWQMTLIGKDV